jgi:hypothetical protein
LFYRKEISQITLKKKAPIEVPSLEDSISEE